MHKGQGKAEQDEARHPIAEGQGWGRGSLHSCSASWFPLPMIGSIFHCYQILQYFLRRNSESSRNFCSWKMYAFFFMYPQGNKVSSLENHFTLENSGPY